MLRNNELQLRNDSITSDLPAKRNNSFWNKVKARRGKISPDADFIDGTHEQRQNAETFFVKFSSMNGAFLN